MKSEHRHKKRGRSESPAKKKSKKKYRHDRSKKSRQSSSDSYSSSEDISLSSDEYPSSSEERRKEAKKKRSKKSKKKSRASVSSSRSPSVERHKKSKSKERKSSKHKKEKKRSPSSKKKRRRDYSSSESSVSRSPSPRKAVRKKKPSPSPERSRKKSLSPVLKKSRKKSASPRRGRGEKRRDTSSPSPSRVKKRASRSPSKEGKRKRDISPVRTKKRKSRSPVKGDSKSSSSVVIKSRRKSPSPSPEKEKKERREKKDVSPNHRSKKKEVSPTLTRKVSPDRSKRKENSPTSTRKVDPSRSRKKEDSPDLSRKVSSKRSKDDSPVSNRKLSPTRSKKKGDSPYSSRKVSPTRSKNRDSSPVSTRKVSPEQSRKKDDSHIKTHKPSPNQSKSKDASPATTRQVSPSRSTKKDDSSDANGLKKKSPLPMKLKSPSPATTKSSNSPISPKLKSPSPAPSKTTGKVTEKKNPMNPPERYVVSESQRANKAKSSTSNWSQNEIETPTVSTTVDKSGNRIAIKQVSHNVVTESNVFEKGAKSSTSPSKKSAANPVPVTSETVANKTDLMKPPRKSSASPVPVTSETVANKNDSMSKKMKSPSPITVSNKTESPAPTASTKKGEENLSPRVPSEKEGSSIAAVVEEKASPRLPSEKEGSSVAVVDAEKASPRVPSENKEGPAAAVDEENKSNIVPSEKEGGSVTAVDEEKASPRLPSEKEGSSVAAIPQNKIEVLSPAEPSKKTEDPSPDVTVTQNGSDKQKSISKKDGDTQPTSNTPSKKNESPPPSKLPKEKVYRTNIKSKKESPAPSRKSPNPSRHRKKSKSPSPSRNRRKSKSPSPSRSRRKSKSPSPTRSRRKSRSVSPSRSRKERRSASPRRSRKKSESISPIRSRKRSKSPKRERRRSRSRSPGRHRKDDRKSPVKSRKRSRSRSRSPLRSSRKGREKSPELSKDSKRKKEGDHDHRRKEEDRTKSSERSSDRRERDDKDRERSKRSDTSKDHKRSDDRRKEEDERRKREKSPDPRNMSEIEESLKKRKERIEAWRRENRKKDDDNEGLTEKQKAEKKWSLEDDEDEEERKREAAKGGENSAKSENNENGEKSAGKVEESEEEDDPLDAFMKSIDKEVKKQTGGANVSKSGNANSKAKTITVVKTVVAKKEEVKPEVMEQNQDALEYSSEEETANDITASDFTDVTKKKKELTVADHTMIYYAPFKRNFYLEVPELARMSADEVKLFRDSLGDIQVRGKNIPKPIKSWAQAGLSAKVMNVLKRCSYEKPTPIQAQALPVVMSGRDMIGIAKTGSGKTLAFLLPMLRHVMDQPALDEDDGPIAIIMTPTRELALQIFREGKKFCRPLNLTVACIYGGSGISEQIAELKRGAEVIVCTPGRMIDMLAANNGRVTNCRRCTYLVLDEADRMFDMGFEPQVMRIIGNIRPDRQTVLFSATFPRQMEATARKVLTKPIEVQVGGRSVVCSDVEQQALVIDEDNKFFKVLELLGVYQEKGSILIFVEKQETADSLFKDLLKKGYPCLSLHGGMDQYDRDSTIADFKNGVTKLMVSTSVAARGLDVKNLILVVNYDCPNHYEDYVHRVGRTGRAGNKGTAFTFLTPEQGRNAGDIIKAFELSKCEPPATVLLLWNLFKEEMEKQGQKIKMNSGFSGKGFKFNAEEDAQVNESKKMQKFALGLQDSDDEAEAAENAMDKIEADLEKVFSSKPKVALQPEVVEAQKVKAAEQNVNKDKLKQASDIAALINKKLSSGQVIDRNTAATANIMQGVALESLTGVGLAKQLADKVNAKLNYKPADVEAEAEKPIAVRYEEEIDINDFPQQARWRITSKEIIEQVRELSEAGVTVRGLYIPPNKKPNEEEKRLHLYIESLSERSIQIAKAEIKRMLKEELMKAESNTYRPAQPTGRYKVL